MCLGGVACAGTPWRKSDDPADFREARARAAREQLGGIAITEAADEVALDLRTGEEFSVDRSSVETGHRATVEAEGARGEHEVGTLQAAVAEGSGGDQRFVADEPGFGVGVREQAGQFFVEGHVHAKQGGDGGGHCLATVAFHQQRDEAGLGFRRLDEDRAQRPAIGAGRSPFHQVVQFDEQAVGNGSFLPDVMGAGIVEELVEGGDFEFHQVSFANWIFQHVVIGLAGRLPHRLFRSKSR